MALLALALALIGGIPSAATPFVVTVPSAATAPAPHAPRPQPVLDLPVPQGQVVALAHIPTPNWKPGHRGVDILAPTADVVAPGDGTVAFVGQVAGRPVVTVALDVGVTATVEPVVGGLDVGSRIRQGDVVGTVTAQGSHCAPRTCVHWGIRAGEVYQDPVDWLRGWGPITLLPLPRD